MLAQESGLLDKEEERKKFIASLCVVDIQGLQDIGMCNTMLIEPMVSLFLFHHKVMRLV